MQQMPPLPVRLNVELANNFLPKAVANGMCQFPYVPPSGGAFLHRSFHDGIMEQPVSPNFNDLRADCVIVFLQTQ